MMYVVLFFDAQQQMMMGGGVRDTKEHQNENSKYKLNEMC